MQETAAAVIGDDRASFLRKAAFGSAAVIGGGSLLGMLPSVASAATPASDVAILNFALTLEYLEAEFYAGARKNAGIFKGDTRNFVDVVAKRSAAQRSRSQATFEATAGSILTVEARHAAWMRHIRQVPPAPLAFDKPKTNAQILAAVKKTGFIVG